jgi:FMN phosphatase YigB (HAD superfamily)
MTEYRVEGFKDLEAVTFDHYKTIQYSTIKNQEDIIHPIIRSLKTRIDLDEEKFLGRYVVQDKQYRMNERETFVETTLDELVFKALLDSEHYDAELSKIVKAAVNHGLHTRQLTWYQDAKETLLRHWRYLPERRRELQPFFDVITLSYEHGYVKPHPSIFHTTLMRLKVKPETCLHVGDDPYADVWGAKKAGMKACYIRRNELDAEADVIIQRLSELIRYLDM